MLKKTAALVVLAALAVTGCSATTEAEKKSAPVLHASLQHEYKSLAELREDSSLVVRVTAAHARVRTLHTVPFTITEVKVQEVLKGKTENRTLSVQQLGSLELASPDTSQLLEKGREYILFLEPYHLVPGDHTGLHTITGEQGIYGYSSEKQAYEYASGSEARVPKSLTRVQISALQQPAR
ncbi:hypothetical protein [Streptomyces sp. NPDC051310]|uniref:hypothetical protein n=1 Tax=Streptomyces sp. NPDC051310 TaxID=3365649 RepID=UPI0037B9EC14